MKQMKELAMRGKRVLIRADLNVPFKPTGEIADDNRIKQFVPTLKAVIEAGGLPIVMSHHSESKLSIRACAAKLSELAGIEVRFAPACIGAEVETMAKELEPGRALLLENLRFNDGEEANDPQFAAALAKLGEVFINDAFATAHRKHASMVGVPALFKDKAPGLLMRAEMDAYERAMLNPKRPVCFVLGGAKVSTKLNILFNIANIADKLIIGGAMANTFLAAQGIQVGRSLYEKDLVPKALELLGSLARRGSKVYLPVDLVVGPSPTAKGLGRAVPVQEMPADTMALDIGPATSLLYREALTTAETIVWNGPMGAFENEDYAKGTFDMIESIAACHATSIVGGGDTDAAIHHMELGHKFTHISTGGGAFLQLLEGKGLPGFKALE